MFSAKSNVKSTLLCGPAEFSKTFMFEVAIYWAEEGRRVVYITPAPLERLPAGCHDRSNPAPAAFKLMRFMYLENHEALMERLNELHTFHILPSVLLFDDFDAYVNDHKATGVMHSAHIARTCAAVLDSINSCARVLDMDVHVCAWSSSATNDISTYTIYFFNIWNVKQEEETNEILLEKCGLEACSKEYPSYKFCKLRDETIVLKQILYRIFEEQEIKG
ncbi:uncharacterized protein LOC108628432 [Ceratina calcarata]|uniref:Uncharacterized protein LOC108628432 n=1 Tax=Ceratina calcarata TaxID=156304 RepID=A0AAJ7J6E4_9HYME|nr:uncharacterized protein LOC108628432 [Ceratina calcarata]